jgi:predicted PurR-regulated permease PerM
MRDVERHRAMRSRSAVLAAELARTPDPDVSPDSDIEAPVVVTERIAGSLRVVAAVALVAALWWGKVVLIPIVLSVLISYALEPIVARLESWHVPRLITVPVLMTLLLASGVAVGYGLRGEAAAFVERLPAGAHVVATAIQRATRGTPGAVSKVKQAAYEIENAANAATKGGGRDGVTAVRIEEPTFRWSDWLWQGSHGAMEFAGQSVAVFCLVYFLLMAGDLYKRKIVRMVPTLADRQVTVGILDEIDRQIERFLIARVVISLVVGVAVWLSFRMLGVEEAGIWGVISSVLYAIPILGPTAVVIGAAIAAFVQFGSLEMTAAVAGMSVAIGVLEGNVLTPWLMSRAGDMNAGAVFVSLMFWGWIWGVWGLLLAVPITAAVKATCERIPDFNALAELLKK